MELINRTFCFSFYDSPEVVFMVIDLTVSPVRYLVLRPRLLFGVVCMATIWSSNEDFSKSILL